MVRKLGYQLRSAPCLNVYVLQLVAFFPKLSPSGHRCGSHPLDFVRGRIHKQQMWAHQTWISANLTSVVRIPKGDGGSFCVGGVTLRLFSMIFLTMLFNDSSSNNLGSSQAKWFVQTYSSDRLSGVTARCVSPSRRGTRLGAAGWRAQSCRQELCFLRVTSSACPFLNSFLWWHLLSGFAHKWWA